MKKRILIAAFLSFIPLISFADDTPLPESYEACLSDPRKGEAYGFNDSVLCALYLGADESAAAYEECDRYSYSMSLVDVGPSDCVIYYYNPHYELPSNFRECVEDGGKSPFRVECSIEIDPGKSYNKTVAEKLYNECKNKDGWLSGTACGIIFQRNLFFFEKQIKREKKLDSHTFVR